MAIVNPEFDDMTVVDLTNWLEQQGIPNEFCEKFSGVYIAARSI